jgi:hypothetical protein
MWYGKRSMGLKHADTREFTASWYIIARLGLRQTTSIQGCKGAKFDPLYLKQSK